MCQDYYLAWKNEINYDDILSLPFVTALTGMKVSNKEKDIKKNDSAFELHDQWITAVQASYLVNMFDNFNSMYPDKLLAVEKAEDVIRYMLDMLEEFQVQLYYEPDKQMIERDGEDDLFKYCQVIFIIQFFDSLK